MTEVIEEPKVMPKKVADLIKYHLKKEKIVYIIEDTDEQCIYMLKSIHKDSQTYNVVHDKIHNTWVCDCPAFKFRRRLHADHCKHIEFIKILIAEKIEIEFI